MVKTTHLERFANDLQNGSTVMHNYSHDPYQMVNDKTVQLNKLEGRQNKPGLYDAHELRFVPLPNNGISTHLSKFLNSRSSIEMKKGDGRNQPIYHL